MATSVSGKGCIPDAHPLAVGWGYGKQGTRAAEAAFKDVDLVLAVGVRYSEVSTANYAIPQPRPLIHVDINPQNLGRNVPTHVCVRADCASFPRPAARRRRRDPPPPLPRRSGKTIRDVPRGRPLRSTGRSAISRGVDPMFFLAQLRDVLGPG